MDLVEIHKDIGNLINEILHKSLIDIRHSRHARSVPRRPP